MFNASGPNLCKARYSKYVFLQMHLYFKKKLRAIIGGRRVTQNDQPNLSEQKNK